MSFENPSLLEIQSAQIEDLKASAEEIFAQCTLIEDSSETLSLKPGEQPRQGGYLLIGTRDEEDYFISKASSFFGHLQEHQVKPGKKNPESKFTTYWTAVWTKCSALAGKLCPFPAEETDDEYKYSKVYFGAIEVPSSGLIVGFSGFLEHKDELYVLTLLVKNNLIKLSEAIEIAALHNNDLFLNNFTKLGLLELSD